jgi:hypothetical protein
MMALLPNPIILNTMASGLPPIWSQDQLEPIFGKFFFELRFVIFIFFTLNSVRKKTPIL